MISALTLFRLVRLPDLAQVEECLAGAAFAECGPTQEHSSGWVRPRGEEHGAFVEAIGGHWLAQHCIETRGVPGDALRRDVDARAARIEQETGRRPGKKERRDLRGDALLALLPHAFPRRALTWVWIDPSAQLLGVASVSRSRVDSAVTSLVQALPRGAAVQSLDTRLEPRVVMASWLIADEPSCFVIDRECELQAMDESRAVVRYGRHPLDIEEVRQHIEAGKRPTRLAMIWEDRVSFTLTASFQLKGIRFLDATVDGHEDAAAFDARAAIATGELARMVPALLAALGGEMERA